MRCAIDRVRAPKSAGIGVARGRVVPICSSNPFSSSSAVSSVDAFSRLPWWYRGSGGRCRCRAGRARNWDRFDAARAGRITCAAAAATGDGKAAARRAACAVNARGSVLLLMVCSVEPAPPHRAKSRRGGTGPQRTLIGIGSPASKWTASVRRLPQYRRSCHARPLCRPFVAASKAARRTDGAAESGCRVKARGPDAE